ncbi:hypothetical protein [Actinocrispum sp. NPDC049592]|uniref:ComF family protein n=1 Tax=Actinocrispum sp. NPDC049592 TaxID=3154835 RepID=UPI00343D1E07
MLRSLIELLVPMCCAGCETPGSVLCPRCRRDLTDPFLVRAKGPPWYALAPYDGAARRAVLAYKERGRRELAPVFGELLAAALPRLPPADYLVPVPSRPSAARRRGGQHMLLIANHTGHPVLPALHLDRKAKDSVGLDPTQRAANLAGRLIPTHPIPPNRKVILLDDIITTGATTTACTTTLTNTGTTVTATLALTAARAAMPWS